MHVWATKYMAENERKEGGRGERVREKLGAGLRDASKCKRIILSPGRTPVSTCLFRPSEFCPTLHPPALPTIRRDLLLRERFIHLWNF